MNESVNKMSKIQWHTGYDSTVIKYDFKMIPMQSWLDWRIVGIHHYQPVSPALMNLDNIDNTWHFQLIVFDRPEVEPEGPDWKMKTKNYKKSFLSFKFRAVALILASFKLWINEEYSVKWKLI